MITNFFDQEPEAWHGYHRSPIRREHWYDIYGLSEKREAATINAFLGHFADRSRIEYIKREELLLVPAIPLAEKHKLFENLYPSLDDTSGLIPPLSTLDLSKYPASEKVKVRTLTDAIELGISRKNSAFSIYILKHTRIDIKCLLVHFTVDNKVILGVSVAKKDQVNQNNRRLALKIKEEMEGVVPPKTSSVWFDQPPPDSEDEFLEAKDHSELSRASSISEDRIEHCFQHQLFYEVYRAQLHQKVRLPFTEVNDSNYFTLGDNKGQILNLIRSHGNAPSYHKVQNPHAKDVAKLTSLLILLQDAARDGDAEFKPDRIHIISIPPESETESIWRGHRDGASDFTVYEGIRTSAIFIKDTFHLSKIEDLKSLAEEGFFLINSHLSIFSHKSPFELWLLENKQAQLYLDILQDEDELLKVDTEMLLLLIGKQDWKKFVAYLHHIKVGKKELKAILLKMCGPETWQPSQLEDILQMVALSDKDYIKLLSTASKNFQYDLYELLFSKKKPRLSLFRLTEGIKSALSHIERPEAIQFISFYLQQVEKKYSTFCDYEVILTLAALEEKQDMLAAVLKLLPPENWYTPELLNIAMATENTHILGKLNYSASDIDQFRQREEEWMQHAKIEYFQIVSKAVREGNYFKTAYIASIEAPNNLSQAFTEAAELGLIGTVKVLVEIGKLDPTGVRLPYYNSLKNTTRRGYHRLKHYLQSKGMKKQELE